MDLLVCIAIVRATRCEEENVPTSLWATEDVRMQQCLIVRVFDLVLGDTGDEWLWLYILHYVLTVILVLILVLVWSDTQIVDTASSQVHSTSIDRHLNLLLPFVMQFSYLAAISFCAGVATHPLTGTCTLSTKQNANAPILAGVEHRPALRTRAAQIIGLIQPPNTSNKLANVDWEPTSCAAAGITCSK